jgi:hypothetical protein
MTSGCAVVGITDRDGSLTPMTSLPGLGSAHLSGSTNGWAGFAAVDMAMSLG